MTIIGGYSQAYILLPFVVIKIGEGWWVWPAIGKTLQYIYTSFRYFQKAHRDSVVHDILFVQVSSPASGAHWHPCSHKTETTYYLMYLLVII